MLEAPRPQATQLRWDVRICSDAPTLRLPREVHTAFPEYPIPAWVLQFRCRYQTLCPSVKYGNRANFSRGKGLPTKGGALLRSEQYHPALPANSGATKTILGFYKLGRRFRFCFWTCCLCCPGRDRRRALGALGLARMRRMGARRRGAAAVCRGGS